MHLKIQGNVGKQELLETLAGLINSLEDAGVTDFRGVNIYLNPYVCGVKVTAYMNGFAANIISVSKKKHQHIIKGEDGKITTQYDTGIKGSDINLDGRIPCRPTVTFKSTKAVEEEELEKQRLRVLEIEKLRELQTAALTELRIQEDELKRIGGVCIADLMERLNLTLIEFKEKRSSSSWLKTQKGIAKYTNKLISDKAFRISMNIKGSKEKKVYLYNENGELVYES